MKNEDNFREDRSRRRLYQVQTWKSGGDFLVTRQPKVKWVFSLPKPPLPRLCRLLVCCQSDTRKWTRRQRWWRRKLRGSPACFGNTGAECFVISPACLVRGINRCLPPLCGACAVASWRSHCSRLLSSPKPDSISDTEELP
ncbi:hypothetical protein XENOCAPTIV_016140 [Xenoophorus captivus]|uniref:Uncharacterized protein n=1 Tax=Xenoophorus captivus TaxID=1517983 RepID=A0ABV0QD65_9TELE